MVFGEQDTQDLFQPYWILVWSCPLQNEGGGLSDLLSPCCRPAVSYCCPTYAALIPKVLRRPGWLSREGGCLECKL